MRAPPSRSRPGARSRRRAGPVRNLAPRAGLFPERGGVKHARTGRGGGRQARSGGHAEDGGAQVVELAAEAERRRKPRPADRPARPNPRFEGMLCRAVAERLLVELRYDS